jgi:hypothetical protein
MFQLAASWPRIVPGYDYTPVAASAEVLTPQPKMTEAGRSRT